MGLVLFVVSRSPKRPGKAQLVRAKDSSSSIQGFESRHPAQREKTADKNCPAVNFTNILLVQILRRSIAMLSMSKAFGKTPKILCQGSLTEAEGSVQLTS
jgi:hypothetical protein